MSAKHFTVAIAKPEVSRKNFLHCCRCFGSPAEASTGLPAPLRAGTVRGKALAARFSRQQHDPGDHITAFPLPHPLKVEGQRISGWGIRTPQFENLWFKLSHRVMARIKWERGGENLIFTMKSSEEGWDDNVTNTNNTITITF